MQKNNYRVTKFACYAINLSMAAVITLSPLLFTTFRSLYSVSYTLLGTLVLINFISQLTIDLIFSFFSKRFNIALTVRIMPVINLIGMLIYALLPKFFPEYAYLCLVVGTVIFSISAGLSEVLISPLVAAMPSENPDREMSKLHSVYAWSVVAVALVSAAFIKLFGAENWHYMVLLWATVPLVCTVLFLKSPIPDVNRDSKPRGSGEKMNKGLIALFVLCIFFGSASENTMTNWSSGYVESALGLSKTLSDILGMAMFALALGIGRTLYGKIGKNIMPVLMFGFVGALICYLTAGLSKLPVFGLLSCILTGFCTAMLWPGTLIMAENKYNDCGVFVYAMLAAGGDFGASVAPQLLGIVTDAVSTGAFAAELGAKYGLSPEQIGLHSGMLLTALFPLMGVIVMLLINRKLKADPNDKQSMLK